MDKRRGGGITIFYQSFCLTILKNVVEVPFCVSESFGYRKFLWREEKRGVYHNFLSKFLSHSTKKYRRGTLVCFRKNRVSKIFKEKRTGVCITSFCQSLCLTVPKNIVWQHFSVSEKIGFRKNLRTMRGFQYFLLIIFCLTVPKTFVGKHFCVSEKNQVSTKLTDNKETLIFSVDNFLSHSAEKFRRGPLPCFI